MSSDIWKIGIPNPRSLQKKNCIWFSGLDSRLDSTPKKPFFFFYMWLYQKEKTYQDHTPSLFLPMDSKAKAQFFLRPNLRTKYVHHYRPGRVGPFEEEKSEAHQDDQLARKVGFPAAEVKFIQDPKTGDTYLRVSSTAHSLHSDFLRYLKSEHCSGRSTHW